MREMNGSPRNGGASPIGAKSKRRKAMFWFRLTLGLGLFGWLAFWVNWSRMVELALGVQPWSLFAAFLVVLATRPLTAYKWLVLVHAKRFYPSFSFLLRLVFVSNFLGVFLPTGVGGDAVRMYGLARVYENKVESVSSVLVDRLTSVAMLLSLIVVGAGITNGTPLGNILVPAAFVPSTILLAGLLVLLSPVGHHFSRGLTGFVSARYGYDFLMRIDSAVRSYGKMPGMVIKILGTSLIVQACRVLEVYLVADALGVELSILDAIIVVPPALFIGMLPVTVGGFGLREGAIVVLLGLVGTPLSDAFAIALVVRAINLVSHLPGVAWFVRSGLQTDRTSR